MSTTYQFDEFELHTRPFRLLREGEEVPLQPQPARALELLASRAGEVVSRDDLRRHLWGDGVHVEHEQAINFTIRKIRAALGDDAQSPRFVETIPRQGYRFVAPVVEHDEPPGREPDGDPDRDPDGVPKDLLGGGTGGATDDATDDATGNGAPAADPARRPGPLAVGASLVALLALVLLGVALWPRDVDPARGDLGRGTSSDTASGSGFDDEGLEAGAEHEVGKLAVLPLEARSDDPGAQALAEVLSEELVAHLASRLAPRRGSGGLAVVTLRATRALRGEDPETAGRRLGADLLLGGTLVQETGGLRLSARLWRVGDRVNVWADTFEVAADEVDDAWEHIAAGVGEASGVGARAISPAPRFELGPDQQTELWQAQMLVQTGEVEVVEEGIRRLEALAEEVPEAPQVHVAVADAWMAWSLVPPMPYGRPFADYFPRVEAAARRALELDPANLSAWVHLASVLFNVDHDWEESRRILEEEVLRRSPRHAAGLHLYGILLGTIGRFDEGIATIRQAVELDPVTLFVTSDLATAYFMARRYEEAIEQAERNLELSLDDSGNTWMIIDSLRLQGRREEALAVAREHYREMGIEVESLESLFPRVLNFLRHLSAAGHPALTVQARLHMAVGQHEEALGALEAACDGRGDFQLPWAAVNPIFDPLRDHPRYQALEGCLAPVVGPET